MVLTWDQEFHLTWIVVVIAGLMATWLNHRYHYLIYIPGEDLGKRGFIKLTVVTVTLFLCSIVVLGGLLKILDMHSTARLWGF